MPNLTQSHSQNSGILRATTAGISENQK